MIVTLKFVECVGVTVILLVLTLAIYWLYWRLKKINLTKLKKNFFQRNGGLLLQQQLSTHNLTIQTIKIFTEEELKEATNNYHENRILGHEGQGTVYKGILPDNRIVAIKKSVILNQSQVKQFINEVIILSQVHHRKCGKLVGMLFGDSSTSVSV